MEEDGSVHFALEFVITTAKSLNLFGGEDMKTIVDRAKEKGFMLCCNEARDIFEYRYGRFFEEQLVSVLKEEESIIVPTGTHKYADVITRIRDSLFFQTNTQKEQEDMKKGSYQKTQKFLFCIPRGCTKRSISLLKT